MYEKLGQDENQYKGFKPHDGKNSMKLALFWQKTVTSKLHKVDA